MPTTDTAGDRARSAMLANPKLAAAGAKLWKILEKATVADHARTARHSEIVLAMDAAIGKTRDADPDEGENLQREKNKERAGVLRAKLHDALGDDADPETLRLIDELCQIASVSVGDQSEEDEEGREGSPAAEDDPPDFPGKPKPGGEMVDKKGMDAAIDRNRRARLAKDAARRAPPTADYSKRWPSAARIGKSW